MVAQGRDHILAEVVMVDGVRHARDLLAAAAAQASDRARRAALSLREGPERLAEVRCWPVASDVSEGSIVKVALEGAAEVSVSVLAEPETALAALYRLIARYGVDPFYPASVRAEAQAWLDTPGLDDPALEDLDAYPFVTIDNEDSRDLDQALYIKRGPEAAGYVLYYALSDAAYYVRPGTALFDESIKRGASFYLPGTTSPMLPRVLSEGLVSLNPEVPRRALVFEITMDEQGELASPTRIFRGLIRSRAKLTYHGVQRLHDAPCASPLTEQPYTESLMLMREVGERRMALARQRDVIPFNRVSPSLSFADEARASLKVTMDTRIEVERWNEQISLLCNMEGARFLASAVESGAGQVQPIYRVHPFPEPSALRALAERLRDLAEALHLDPEIWTWDYSADGAHVPLADFVESLPDAPQWARQRQAVERQVMWAISPSGFTEQRGPHFGIGAELYSRFSSPMREIVGVFTHKEALERLDQSGDSDRATSLDEKLRARVIEVGNHAKRVQRRLTNEALRMAMARHFNADLALPFAERPRRAGTLLGVRKSRLYVQLDLPPMEIKVYHDLLARADGGDVTVRRDRTGIRRADGQALFVGDGVGLVVHHYDERKDRWCFVPEKL